MSVSSWKKTGITIKFSFYVVFDNVDQEYYITSSPSKSDDIILATNDQFAAERQLHLEVMRGD